MTISLCRLIGGPRDGGLLNIRRDTDWIEVPEFVGPVEPYRPDDLPREIPVVIHKYARSSLQPDVFIHQGPP